MYKRLHFFKSLYCVSFLQISFVFIYITSLVFLTVGLRLVTNLDDLTDSSYVLLCLLASVAKAYSFIKHSKKILELIDHCEGIENINTSLRKL